MTFDDMNRKLKAQFDDLKNDETVKKASRQVKDHVVMSGKIVTTYVKDHVDQEKIKASSQQAWHETKKTVKRAIRDLDRHLNGSSIHDDDHEDES